jgi:hypothetical protein
VFYKNYLKHNKPYPALNCEREKIVVPEEPEIESPAWRKSQHSTASGECVEITAGEGRIGVRDSKDPDGSILFYAPEGWDFLPIKPKGVITT